MSRRVNDEEMDVETEIETDIEADIEAIRQEYRRLKAPDHTLRRVHARLPGARPRRLTLPAAGTALAATLAVAALLLALPRVDRGEAEIRPTSLTVLSLAAGSKPAGAVPGLSSVRGMSLPAPPGPATGAGAVAPSPTDTELEDLRNHSRDEEEKDHANS
ncbi:MAG TPA: hypothetical protein VFF18_00440 [Woeseiaceae bacterium]|nr:hypothetical protein [Woeseiaceae bacterium]